MTHTATLARNGSFGSRVPIPHSRTGGSSLGAFTIAAVLKAHAMCGPLEIPKTILGGRWMDIFHFYSFVFICQCIKTCNFDINIVMSKNNSYWT